MAAPSITVVAEGVGLLTQLDTLRAEDAIEFLRELAKPGTRFIDGQLLYSAAFLDGEIQGQEVLPL